MSPQKIDPQLEQVISLRLPKEVLDQIDQMRKHSVFTSSRSAIVRKLLIEGLKSYPHEPKPVGKSS